MNLLDLYYFSCFCFDVENMEFMALVQFGILRLVCGPRSLHISVARCVYSFYRYCEILVER